MFMERTNLIIFKFPAKVVASWARARVKSDLPLNFARMTGLQAGIILFRCERRNGERDEARWPHDKAQLLL